MRKKVIITSFKQKYNLKIAVIYSLFLILYPFTWVIMYIKNKFTVR